MSETPQAPQSIPPAAASASPTRRRVLIGVGALALVFGLYKGWDYVVEGRYTVATDDAYVKADTAIIAAKVPGYIRDVQVLDNQRVEKGDILLTLDDGDYRLTEEAAREKVSTQEATMARITEQDKAQVSQVRQAAAQIEAAQADVRRADAAFARTTTLARSNISSVATLDTARADKDRAQANLVAAQAALDSARASRTVIEAQRLEAEKLRAELMTSLEKAKRDRDFTQIRAPFAGVVGNRAAQTGAYVQTGSRLLALVPLQSVYIEANFKETQLANLKPGQVVTIRLDAKSDRRIEGRVGSIAPASGSQFSLLPPDNATGNFTKIVQRVPVRIEIPAAVAAEGWVRPGLSVIAEVHTNKMDERKLDQAQR